MNSDNFLISWFEYVSSRTDLVQASLIVHINYVVLVIVSATFTALLIAVATRRNYFLKELSLAITAVFLTIPSLALFTIFIPLVGLGFAPSFIALYLYSLLPILRNTITGLESIDPNVIESARGMGYTKRQILLKIEFPLAWPVILAGIRTSAMLVIGIAAIATLVAGGGLGDFIKSGLARLPLPNALEAIWTGVVLSLLLAFVFDSALRLLKKTTISKGIR
jgi:osmoprotectant transport system permease protein